LNWHVCDTLDSWELERAFREIGPAAVIHTAAVADINFAEQNRELARAVNVEMTRALVKLCAEVGCRMVFCSTDTVFDGERAPYREQDEPRPVNFYGHTKVEAEKIVTTLSEQAVIARLAIVMGLPVVGAGNSFMAKMLADLKEGKSVVAFTDEVRTPLDVITAGRALLELAAGNQQGVFHLAGSERLIRFELAQRIAPRFGFNPGLVLGQPAAGSKRPARRPRDVSLDNRKARAQLQTPMLMLDEALELILEGQAKERGEKVK
jgi:dTDP-4-dehydrorhamnose reductase